MSESFVDKTCELCKFAIPFKIPSAIVQSNQGKTFECRFNPPQILVLPSGSGRVSLKSEYVKVSDNFPACSHYSENNNTDLKAFDLSKILNRDTKNQES